MISPTQLMVKEFLRDRGWTTKMLAEKTGMSESYLTHIKNSTRRWNEDILKRLADAFGVHPVELFAVQKKKDEKKAEDDEEKKDKEEEVSAVATIGSIATPVKKSTKKKFESKQEIPKTCMIPVMTEIPSAPSPYNNELTQITSGCKGMFVPVVGASDKDMFCYKVENSHLKPRFERGDYLVISPGTGIRNSDIVAVEYGDINPVRTFMQVSFVDDYTILEPLNPAKRKTPIVMHRGQDTYRIIGRVVYRYQSYE